MLLRIGPNVLPSRRFVTNQCVVLAGLLELLRLLRIVFVLRRRERIRIVFLLRISSLAATSVVLDAMEVYPLLLGTGSV